MASKKLWTKMVLTTALAGGMLMAVGGSALADRDWSADCHQRLEADRARIDHDAARFGDHSPAVARDVARMDRTRQWCRDHKADWDHDHFDTGIYIHL